MFTYTVFALVSVSHAAAAGALPIFALRGWMQLECVS
jgi:hypothetical protein